MSEYRKLIRDGLWDNNQALVALLGLCPLLAVTSTAVNGLGLGIATTLVLVAVFIPVASMGGITGRLYQQFAITIAISVAISSINALTLSPALASSLLKLPGEQKQSIFHRFFGVFNRALAAATDRFMILADRLEGVAVNLVDKALLLGHVLAWRARWDRRDLDYLPAERISDKFMTGREAASLIPDGATVISSGMAGNSRCSAFYWAIRERYEAEGRPKGLTWISVGGVSSKKVADQLGVGDPSRAEGATKA